MTAFAYAFLLGGIILVRQVAVGRASSLAADSKELLLSFLNGDSGGMGEVLTRRGTNVDASGVSTDPVLTSELITPTSQTGSSLVDAVKGLGKNAAGYRLGATGPSYYDCSGLVWKALTQIGAYKGSRFTTSTFESICKGFASEVSKPLPGDIVLWPGKHMGVCDGNDSMYSARSPEKGIGASSISGDSGYFHKTPNFWRLK